MPKPCVFPGKSGAELTSISVLETSLSCLKAVKKYAFYPSFIQFVGIKWAFEAIEDDALTSAQHQHRDVGMRQNLLCFAAQQQAFDPFATV